MRKINKGIPFCDFTHYVEANHPTDWSQLPGSISYAARCHILKNEQDGICGYTELCLSDNDSHIDHYVKQSIDSSKIFIWDNLIVASVDEDFGAKYKDNGYKIKPNEYVDIFNPVVDHVELYCYFLVNGEIHPRNDILPSLFVKMQRTIEVFNLNHPSLTSRRANVVQNVHNYFKGGIELGEIFDYLQTMGFHSVILQEIRNLEETA